MNTLVALLDGREAGVVSQTSGKLRFRYSDSWRAVPGAYPLSLSMPIAAAEHGHAAVEPFLWGLLPDNEIVLSRWAQRFQVSARSAFALLAHVGEDCAGAVQFVRPGRLAQINSQPGEVRWLTEAEIAARLRDLRRDASTGRVPGDNGQFSLAGAQPKTALLFDGQRWGVPSGRLPTTHILKPASAEWDGHAENEHLCLSLARALGLPAAATQVMRFEDETAILVTRYDRVAEPDGVRRVHQEDMCQALAVHPANKYQNQGGPGPGQIAEFLRESGSAAGDIVTFRDALIFNWLIGGTDAHAKNYSLLIGGNGLVRLAPLYDIASILPYRHVDAEQARLAMKIGDTYRLRDIGVKQWHLLAKQMRLDGDRLVDRIMAMAAELPDRLAHEINALGRPDGQHPLVAEIGKVLTQRVRRISGEL